MITGFISFFLIIAIVLGIAVKQEGSSVLGNLYRKERVGALLVGIVVVGVAFSVDPTMHRILTFPERWRVAYFAGLPGLLVSAVLVPELFARAPASSTSMKLIQEACLVLLGVSVCCAVAIRLMSA